MIGVKQQPCLNCAVALDAVSHLDDAARLEPGCLTVCLYCGHLMVFADDLSLREPTSAEMDSIAGNDTLLEMMDFVGAWREFRGKARRC